VREAFTLDPTRGFLFTDATTGAAATGAGAAATGAGSDATGGADTAADAADSDATGSLIDTFCNGGIFCGGIDTSFDEVDITDAADALFLTDTGTAVAAVEDVAAVAEVAALETGGLLFLTDGTGCSARSSSRIFISALPNRFSPHFAGSFESIFSIEIPIPIMLSPGS